jgi:hypothetical protein
MCAISADGGSDSVSVRLEGTERRKGDYLGGET